MSFDVELPSAYVDAFVDDTTTAPLVVCNRSPEPGEGNIPRSTLLELDIACTSGGTVAVLDTLVFVGDVLAFDGGNFEVGCQGANSAWSTPQADVLRIVIDFETDLASLTEYEVRVQSRASTEASAVSWSWVFTTVDETAPMLLSAAGIGLRRVRVEFDEPMLRDASASSALHPGAWALAPTAGPAVTPVVVSVVEVTDRAFDLELDIDASPGAPYLVTVTGVDDLFGNTVAAPTNVATLTAFSPPVPLGRRFELIDFVPRMNVREDVTHDLRRFVACLQEVTDLMLYDIDRFTDIIDPYTASEPYLDAMLLDLGLPFEFDLSVDDKRRLVLVLVDVYRLKGTAPGIINVVRFFLGIDVTIDSFYNDDTLVLGESELGFDWSLGAGAQALAYSFQVLAPRVLTDDEVTALTQIVNYMKPAHTHFVRLVEPTAPTVIDHLELGLSELGVSWELH